ncbi:MAG: DUF1559 domain-containing protein, partial [Limisphaerales bacterium]
MKTNLEDRERRKAQERCYSPFVIRHPSDPRHDRGSLSIWDLIVILLVVAFLGAWFVFAHSGERGRILQCASNLKALGGAVQSYAKDHNDGLPVAAIIVGPNLVTWDMDLYPYLAPSLANAKSVYDKKQLLAACQKDFACPSDPIERPTPRSYAMAGRNMHFGWPPGPDDNTGVGIIWSKGSVSLLNDDDLVKSAVKNPDLFPRTSQSLLLDPAHTLLLTDYIEPDNIMGRASSAVVFSPVEQQRSLIGYYTNFHLNKFNYLMSDGHVELLDAN